MALKKDFKFSENYRFIADVSFVLSHPARLVIIDLLRERGICSFREFQNRLPLSQPTISQHLQILRRLQFIKHVELPNNTVGYTLERKSITSGFRCLMDYTSAA